MDFKFASLDPQFLIDWGVSIVVALGIVFVGRIVANWAQKLTMRAVRSREYDELIGRFLANIVKYAVLIFAVVAALEKVGVETTGIVAIVASAGLAVGLALQGNLANFSSGVLMLIFRPFELNDVIEAGGAIGRVEEIGLFTTTMKTPDNKKIIIPNSGITGGNIINLTTQSVRGMGVEIGVAYGVDLDEACRVIREAVLATPLVLQEPGPSVMCINFGASSVDFLAKFCVTSEDFTANGSHQAPHNVRMAIYKALDEAGIEIPFAQLVLHKAPVEDAPSDND